MAAIDFFISYTHVDENWAEWIAYILEDNGYSTAIQAWDFQPGSNFVLEMQKAASGNSKTIAVLSPDYLESAYAAPEWAAAFGKDPKGAERTLIPVMVRHCKPEGLLVPIVQIRLMDLHEDTAAKRLLDGLSDKRSKPTSRPAFPGAKHSSQQKQFPGPADSAAVVARPAKPTPAIYLPPTDLDIRTFVKRGFEAIKEVFETNIDTFAGEPRIKADLQIKSTSEFLVDIFVDGNLKNRCRVWQGGMMSENNICFAEGAALSRDGACNEIISLARGKTLAFEAQMGTMLGDYPEDINLKNMTGDEVGRMLWHRFIRPLTR